MKNIFIVVLWILAFSLIFCYMTIRKKKSEVKKTDTGPFAGDSSDRNCIFCDFF